jgi:pyruvate dehydrogenase (quinone)
MQMNGMAELLTAAKYWQRWADPRLIVCVLHNNDLNQVTWEQRAMEGDPRFDASQGIPDFPYARYAELVGFKGIRVDDPDDVGPAWDEALSSDRPVVFEAITDPEVPPLPPHITVEQAVHFLQAVRGGDSGRREMIVESFTQKIEEFLPGR